MYTANKGICYVEIGSMDIANSRNSNIKIAYSYLVLVSNVIRRNRAPDSKAMRHFWYDVTRSNTFITPLLETAT